VCSVPQMSVVCSVPQMLVVCSVSQMLVVCSVPQMLVVCSVPQMSVVCSHWRSAVDPRVMIERSYEGLFCGNVTGWPRSCLIYFEVFALVNRAMKLEKSSALRRVCWSFFCNQWADFLCWRRESSPLLKWYRLQLKGN